MSPTITTVLVDDDEDYVASMSPLLENLGFKVYCYSSLSQMKDELHAVKPDVLLLDLNLPGEHAFDLLPELRSQKDLGLIVISGNTGVETRIEGLEKGADAYLTKPVNIRELNAVIRSIYQRLHPDGKGGWILNSTTWTLLAPNQQEYELTEYEFKFLDQLVRANGQAVSKEAILATLGKSETIYSEASLHVLISRLRKKINHEKYPLPVRAIRNVGYTFQETGKTLFADND